MKELIWDDSLSVQVQEIDEDHRKLMELFNILNCSVVEGDDSNYIEAVFEELISFTIWHFKHEERLMLKYSYNDRLAHKEEHQELIESAKEMLQNTLKEGKSLSSENIEFLEYWLTGHILGADMELGLYLGEVM